MQTTVSVSWQAANTGSQCLSLSWIEGRPSGYGFSGNVTAKHPLLAAALDLLHAEVDVPERQQRQRDEPALAVAGAPLVDDPVVVRLHAEQREVVVGALVERLTAESGEGVGEADRRFGVVGVHVGEAFRLLPAARPDLVERGGGDVELGETDCRRQLRERVDEVVVEPPVARLAALDALLEGEVAAFEVERPRCRARRAARGRGTSSGAARSRGRAARPRGRRRR